MIKDKNHNQKLITYKLSDFFNEKLSLKNKKLFYGNNISLKELIDFLKLDFNKIKKLLQNPELTLDLILSHEQISEISLEYGFDLEYEKTISELNILKEIDNLVKNSDFYLNSQLKSRPPIITIMGHVDHGKTSLLDYIKKTNIVSSEQGGITQRIGAYSIVKNDYKITFIDTPGHEAFTNMRLNGSQITDIVIIVVSAEDSIMPQTKESIDHAKAAGVPMIVAINKIDKPNKNIERITNELSDYGLQPEEWGGKIPFVQISAVSGEGIDNLIEIIIEKAQSMKLEASYDIIANGSVIESNIVSNKGNLISIIVKDGILKSGDYIFIDNKLTKIKAMYDSSLNIIDVAYPSDSVELFGLGFLPLSGSKFSVVSDLKDTKKILSLVENFENINNSKPKNISTTDLFNNFLNKIDNKLKIILKTSSIGTLIALKEQLSAIKESYAEVEIIRADVGEVTKMDISLAESSDASIFSFNLSGKNPISGSQIKINNYFVIYDLIDDIQKIIKGFKKPEVVEEQIGQISIIKIFESSKFGKIIGAIVKEGEIISTAKIKIFDKKEVIIFESQIKTLKIEKNNVKKVPKGKEFGLVLSDMSYEFKENEQILIYKEVIKDE